jgi:beta-glucosidase
MAPLIPQRAAGHEQLRAGTSPKEKLAVCINAGVDLIMIPEKYKEYLQQMQAALKEGLITATRLDEACARVLRLKLDLGLFAAPLADRRLQDRVRCPEHLALARRAVQQSCVLLKNRGPILPLGRQGDGGWLHRLFVCGKGANDLGLTCGGWSCSWQGASGAITTGTTILEALAAALPDTLITYDADGKGLKPEEHEAVLVVVAEDPPYAEWFGDRADLSLGKQDQHVVDRVTQKGLPVVAVILAGRPLIARRSWAAVDALLLAFLPGSEGGLGIVDLLVGAACPTATMPLGLPEGLEVEAEARELFAKGRGLTYEGVGDVGDGDGASDLPPPQPFLRREFT